MNLVKCYVSKTCTRVLCWRPYRVECTGSLPTSEVKRRRARLVLGWGTAREVLRVLSAFHSAWCCLAATTKQNINGNQSKAFTVPHKRRKKLFTLLDLCVSSLRRGHANLLCIVPILTDDPRRESGKLKTYVAYVKAVGRSATSPTHYENKTCIERKSCDAMEEKSFGTS